MTDRFNGRKLVQAGLAVAALAGAGFISAQSQSGSPAARSFRFHTDRKATTGSATAAAAFYHVQPAMAATKRIDWRLLDRTDVRVADGVRDAEIHFPAEIRALDGQLISISGHMSPWQSVEDFTQFVLTQGSNACITCSPPAVTQIIHITQRGSTAAGRPPFAPQAIRVTGRLRLFTFESRHPAHQADFLYALDEAVVEIAPEQIPARNALATPSVFRRRG